MAGTPHHRRRAQIVVFAVTALVIALGAAIWSRTVSSGDDEVFRLGDTSSEVDPASTNPPRVGEALPDVELVDADGNTLVLATDGRPMVVNIWHSNCGPCARELQAFAAADAEFGDRVRFVGVDPLDDIDRMLEFAGARGVEYELLRDEQFALVDSIGLTWYPATLFVDADGGIVAQTGEVSESELRAHVEHLLSWIAATVGLDSDFLGLSFLRGMFASVNPCGFVLLPTYLVYFLGIESSGSALSPGSAGPSGSSTGSRPSGSGGQRASVRRALLVGSAVSAGFVAVFVVVGVFTSFVSNWLVSNSKYITVVIGAAFVILGTAMLAGYRPRFATPHLDLGPRARTVESMFVYGVAYAVASLGCTIGLFLPTIVRGRRDGVLVGVANVVAYGLGMALVVIGLTVSLALANQVLLRALRVVMQHVDLLAASFMVLSGLYLIWYFVVVDVQGESDTITGAVQRWQERATTSLNDHWELMAVVLSVVVVAAVVYVARRPRSSGGDDPDASTPSDDGRELARR